MKIYAISDQHGFLPPIPPCDLLLVAGDNCPDYPGGAKERIGTGPQIDNQERWFRDEWMHWAVQQPVSTAIVLTHGNHCYWAERLHNRHGQIVDLVYEGVRHAGDRHVRIAAVVDGLVEIDGIRIWLTPWSSQFHDWAWMAEDEDLIQRYADIPEDIDILVSHTPPMGYCDEVRERREIEHVGSRSLLAAIVRAHPRVVVCGHIHGGARHRVMPVCDIHVYNVSLVNEAYQLVRKPVEIALPTRTDQLASPSGLEEVL